MRFLLMLFFLLLFNSSFCQTIGIKCGLVNSNIPEFKLDRLNSFDIGLFYLYGEKFKVSIEPSINNKGFSLIEKYTDVNGLPTMEERTKYKFKYLSIPFSFGYYPVNKEVILGANIGMAPTILLDAKESHFGKKIEHTRSINLDLFIGAMFGYSKNHFFSSINIRYGGSFGSVYTINNNYHYNFLNIFLLTGYKF